MSDLERGFVRLPPDSTGKKSAAAARLVIEYQGETDPNLFEAGQTVVGSTSSATANVVGKYTEGFTAGEGQLFLDLDSVSSGPFVVGENLLVSAVSFGTIKLAATLDEIYYQKQVLVDRDSPNRSAAISENGGMRVEFADGPPALSTFGGLIINEPRNVRAYVHAYDSLSGEFYDVTAGSGAISYVSDQRAVTLDTGGTTSGDLSQRTSHFYHPYQAGTMNRLITTNVVGDVGKANVRRRWGLFDDNDGLFWELDGTTLYAVTRASVSGSPVDTRVAQSDFNRDTIDGSNRFNLELDKANIYFIDYQWLGVGLVRFGVYEEDGTQTLAHVFENPNNNVTPYMRQGTLPLRYEIENLDTAASSSEIKHVCSVVQNVGTVNRQTIGFSVVNSSAKMISQASGEVPLVSARSKTTFKGLTNRSVSIIDKVTACNNGLSPVVVRLKYGSVLDGDSYSDVDYNSAIEWDEAASGILAGGQQRWTTVLGAGQTVTESFTSDKDIYQDDLGMIVFADGVTNPGIVLSAEAVDPTASGQILTSLAWKEVKL